MVARKQPGGKTQQPPRGAGSFQSAGERKLLSPVPAVIAFRVMKYGTPRGKFTTRFTKTLSTILERVPLEIMTQ